MEESADLEGVELGACGEDALGILNKLLVSL